MAGQALSKLLSSQKLIESTETLIVPRLTAKMTCLSVTHIDIHDGTLQTISDACKSAGFAQSLD